MLNRAGKLGSTAVCGIEVDKFLGWFRKLPSMPALLYAEGLRHAKDVGQSRGRKL
jgi:hypothetical protein